MRILDQGSAARSTPATFGGGGVMPSASHSVTGNHGYRSRSNSSGPLSLPSRSRSSQPPWGRAGSAGTPASRGKQKPRAESCAIAIGKSPDRVGLADWKDARPGELSAGMRQLAEIVTGNNDLDQMLKLATAEIKKLFSCDIAAVSLLNEASGELRTLPAWTSGVETQLTQPLALDTYSAGFEASPVMSKRPIIVNDVLHDGRVLPIYRAVAERFKMVSVVQIPLIARDRKQTNGEAKASPFTFSSSQRAATGGFRRSQSEFLRLKSFP